MDHLQSRNLMQEFLADRDEPCPGCGYSLRALLSDRCPECNQELRLRVGLVEPRMAWFLAAVIGASAGLGLNVLLLIYLALVFGMGYGGPPPLGYFLWHNVVGATIHATCVLLMVYNGARIRRASLSVRVTLAVLMWALCLVNIVLFARFIR